MNAFNHDEQLLLAGFICLCIGYFLGYWQATLHLRAKLDEELDRLWNEKVGPTVKANLKTFGDLGDLGPQAPKSHSAKERRNHFR